MEASSALSAPLIDDSYDTALCLILPEELRDPVDHFRSLNDKAYTKWPPHVNLIYPFVHPDDLEKAAEAVAAQDWSDLTPIPVALDDVGVFPHKKQNTIVLRPAPEGTSHAAVRSSVCRSRAILGLKPKDQVNPHLTVAQSEDSNSDVHQFLLDKARRLAPIAWEAGELALMIRQNKGTSEVSMRIWGTIDLRTGGVSRCKLSIQPTDEEHGVMPCHSTSQVWQSASAQPSKRGPDAPFSSPTDAKVKEPIERLVVASYNVLAEFEWPPAKTRFPQLVRNLLSQRAEADILVLQEVNDDFLDHLLSEDAVRRKYPHTTHSRPSDPGNGPLPSLLNVVVLSKFPMTWHLLRHQRRHKCSVVVQFTPVYGPIASSSRQPLVLVGVHLSQGLTDGAVATKKQEIQDIFKHLRTHHSGSPCIIAGDLNLTTSAYTTRMALEKGSLSTQGAQKLRNIDHIFKENGFRDAWLSTRLRSGESSSVVTQPRSLADEHEGEQGATFDPLSNTQGMRQTGGGLSNRPQRYDRIYVNGKCELQTAGFNTFGQETTAPTDDNPPEHASDHWGVRCLFLANEPSRPDSGQFGPIRKAQPSLGEMDELKQCLAERGLLPSQADEEMRSQVISILRRVLVEEIISQDGTDQRSKPTLVLVPVGSTALGVWTPESDVDCLCIGGISSRTFFTLALRRLRKAASDNIRILRKVQANTGMMLELKVQGIRVDLQYCSAISIAEQYPRVLDRPPNDPAFALPMQTLLKLKAARDVAYLRRSVPDMAQYRAAHVFIKAWAQSRGIYAPKFGFLGGIHISVLLVPVCKLMAQDRDVFSVSDILLNFFDRYASCDWSKEMVMDPLFHPNTRYHRSFREPMCLLGWHAPSLNTAAAASAPTVNVIAKEFARAEALARQVGQTLRGFLDEGNGVQEFLTSYKVYIRIELHYWGTGKETGNKFLGWFESRCPSILVDLHNKIPTLMPRIWPQRLMNMDDKAATRQPAEQTEYRGQHLIGLGWQDPPFKNSNFNPSEQRKAAEANLIALLPQLETRIQSDEAYYDPRSCWVHFTLVRGSELNAMEVDRSEWGVDLVTDEKWSDEDDFEDETDEEENGDDEESGCGNNEHAEAVSPDAKTGPAGISDPSRANKATTPVLGKFRTATDVLNRLRWDVSMDPNNFIVGYEDRFVGAREKALIHWKSDLSHEEFIPQHRILYFKRQSDGQKVWERRTRTDEIFGSGIPCDTETHDGQSTH